MEDEVDALPVRRDRVAARQVVPERHRQDRRRDPVHDPAPRLPERVDIGMKVESCFRRIAQDGDAGMIYYGTKFRPVR
jgi:hypothetical protein